MYPLTLKLQNVPVLVVGGGKVAFRKIIKLLQEEAKITVVAPDCLLEIKALLQKGQLRLYLREFREEDLKGQQIVFVTTNNPLINKKIAKLCQDKGIWVNVADSPEDSTFFVPAVWRRGGWEIAISTEGRSPLAARLLKEELSSLIVPTWDEYLNFLEKLRRALKEKGVAKIKREKILREIAKLYNYQRYCQEKPNIESILKNLI